jgi:membrane protease YdiL (CAAX protease family)
LNSEPLNLNIIKFNIKGDLTCRTLGLKKINFKSLGRWLLILAVFFLVESLIGAIFKIDSGPFLKEISGSKNFLLVFVSIVLAPLLEEVIFRGYLFKAWRSTRIGLSGTLFATSVLFVLMHWGQYGIIQYVFIFALSILLGLARERTGSLFIPIILHGANNLLPAIGVIFLGAA